MRTSELKGGGIVTISLHVLAAAARPCISGVSLFYPEAAVRPGILTLVSPFLFSYARGRYVLIGRFPFVRTGDPRIT